MAKSEPNGKGCLEFNGTKQQNNVYRFLKVNIKDVDGRPLTGKNLLFPYFLGYRKYKNVTELENFHILLFIIFNTGVKWIYFP